MPLLWGAERVAGLGPRRAQATRRNTSDADGPDGTPADIGNVVALLCTPQAAWITGQLIYADGGASLVDTRMPLPIQHG